MEEMMYEKFNLSKRSTQIARLRSEGGGRILVKRSYELPKKEKKEAKQYDTIYGSIWVDGKRKPIYSYRQIGRGKNKGRYECIYLKKANKFRKIILDWKDITFVPIPFKKGKKNPKLVKRR